MRPFFLHVLCSLIARCFLSVYAQMNGFITPLHVSYTLLRNCLMSSNTSLITTSTRLVGVFCVSMSLWEYKGKNKMSFKHFLICSSIKGFLQLKYRWKLCLRVIWANFSIPLLTVLSYVKILDAKYRYWEHYSFVRRKFNTESPIYSRCLEDGSLL